MHLMEVGITGTFGTRNSNNVTQTERSRSTLEERYLRTSLTMLPTRCSPDIYRAAACNNPDRYNALRAQAAQGFGIVAALVGLFSCALLARWHNK